MPNSNMSKSIARCFAGFIAFLVAPLRRAALFMTFACSHSKCTGSSEFSMHCSQLHGRSVVPMVRFKPSRTKPSHRLNGIGRDGDLVLEARLRVDGLFKGLLEALPLFIEVPAVIRTSDALIIW